MGPYYLTALVHLLGPVKRVVAITGQAFDQRIATCKEQFGKLLAVEVATHYTGSLEFHNGAIITATFSFDVHAHGYSPVKLCGTDGSLKTLYHNSFLSQFQLWTAASKEWQTQALSHRYLMNARGIGAADLTYSILSDGKRRPRASGALAQHVLEVMNAFQRSCTEKTSISIASRPERPDPLNQGLIEGRL